MSTDNKLIGQLTAKTKSLEAELQQARMLMRSRKSAGANSDQKAWVGLVDNSMQPREEEDAWFATYLDMMTLLLVLMIVMLAFAGKGEYEYGTNNDANAMVIGTRADGTQAGAKYRADATGIKAGGEFDKEAGLSTHDGQSTEDRLGELGLDGLSEDIDVVLNDETVSFRINSEILFPSGQADLSLAGVTVLKSLIQVLKKNDFQIAVEGRTLFLYAVVVTLQTGSFPVLEQAVWCVTLSPMV